MDNEELKPLETEVADEKDMEVLSEEAAEQTVEVHPVEDKEENAPVQPKVKRDKKKSILTYLHDFVYLLCAVLIIFLFCARVVVVSGPSMNETLRDGDYLLVLNSIFFREYHQGDIIVASKESFRDGEPIVKRVIAVAGQEVDIDFVQGIVYVDGVALDEPYTNTPTNLQEGMEFPLKVEKGHVFVMGDNRNYSKDSRSPEIGLIDTREILGKAIFLVFPGADSGKREFNRIGVIH